jgi:uncharacterized protein (DUF1501 family)
MNTSKLTRRGLMATGAAAFGAAAIPGAGSRAANAEGAVKGKHLVVVLAQGGWDTTYALDPKDSSFIDSPNGDVTMYGDLPIFTAADRPAVSSFFEANAGMCAVVNGLQMQSIVHTDCMKRLMTGTASDANPDMGSIISYEHGRALPAPYFVLGPTAYTGPLAGLSARVGTLNQIRTLLDPTAGYPTPDGMIAPRYVAEAGEGDLIRKYIEARAARATAVRGQLGANRRVLEDFVSSFERGDALRAFKDGFGDDFAFTVDMATQVTMGVEALERGIAQCVHIEQSAIVGGWDTHDNNMGQLMQNQDLYTGLATLADELASRPGSSAGTSLLDETVVAVISEMGRTPLLNAGGGKDHWPVTSALLFGAGVRHGVYGHSSDKLDAQNVDYATGGLDPNGQQLTYTNLAAGVLQLAGVDSTDWLPNSTPFTAFIA